VEKLVRSESVISNQSEKSIKEEVSSELDSDAIVQPAAKDWAELKPHLQGHKFTEYPLKPKDKDVSGLCSIM